MDICEYSSIRRSLLVPCTMNCVQDFTTQIFQFLISLQYVFVWPSFQSINVRIELNLSDFNNFLTLVRAHNIEQLFPTHVTGSRPYFPRYLRESVTIIRESFVKLSVYGSICACVTCQRQDKITWSKSSIYVYK